MHVTQVEGGQVAIAVEGVEVRTEDGVFPHAFGGDTGAALFRFGHDGDDVETAFERLEGLVSKKRVVGLGGVGDEVVHVFLAIPFSDVGDVHTLIRVCGLHEGLVGRHFFLADVLDEDVRRYHAMGVADQDVEAAGAQLHGHVDRVLGHRQEEDVLERFPHLLGFRVGEPLLKEGGEGVFVDHATVFRSDGDVAVARSRDFGQVLSFAIPARDSVQSDNGDLLFVDISRKIVVDAQCPIFKIVIEVLCGSRGGSTDNTHGQEYLFHTGHLYLLR